MGVFLRTLALVVIVTISAAGLASPATAGDRTVQAPTRLTKTQKLQVAELREGIKFHRSETWQWQDAALRPHTKSNFMERKVIGLGYLKWMAKTWSKRRIAAKTLALNPPHLADWLCIHSGIKNGKWSPSLKYLGGGVVVGKGEAAWTNPGVDWRGHPSIYHGGLQMDYAFQSTYGAPLLQRKGQAENWTPYEQMWVAERAHRSGRGFHPWPNTARHCGLI